MNELQQRIGTALYVCRELLGLEARIADDAELGAAARILLRAWRRFITGDDSAGELAARRDAKDLPDE